jgi:hypothetical protein
MNAETGSRKRERGWKATLRQGAGRERGDGRVAWFSSRNYLENGIVALLLLFGNLYLIMV